MEFDNFKFGINLGSPHQVEGVEPLTDYYAPEARRNTRTIQRGWWSDPDLFNQDLVLAKGLGVSTVRLGVEWARVQPEDGKVDYRALLHYRGMIQAIRNLGLEPMITLHHFTLPDYSARKGGWFNPHIAHDFSVYATEVMDAIGRIPYLITTNEPSVFLNNGYVKGIWPPFERRSLKTLPAFLHLARAHNSVYNMIKNGESEIQVGATEALRGFSPRNPLATVEARTRELLFNTLFFRLTQNDFYGVNYFKNYPLKFGSNYQNVPDGINVDETVFNAPSAFSGAVRRFAKSLPERPIIITENGVNDPTDHYRSEFMRNHLANIKRLREKRLPIVGYQPWNLTDTYEWFEPLGDCRMGLIEVDFETGKRTPRPSYYFYQGICLSGDFDSGTKKFDSRLLDNKFEPRDS